MSIYDKQISDLAPSDLQQLLDDGKAESFFRYSSLLTSSRLNSSLKKLSAFANTYGGYLILGAEADNAGRMLGLPGVDVISNFKQRMVQWCYDGISPPVHPFVSEAIESPQNSAHVCYVIFVEQSEETPHFLNSRKGCYVRTDEFSQRFDPRLATYEEIQHLASRRSLCIERRKHLFSRSERRFKVYVEREYESDPHTIEKLGTR